MRFVSAEEIRKALTFPVLIDAIEAAHRRPKIEVQDGFLGSEGRQYFVRHAVDDGRFMASKLITSFPANLAGGRLPAVQHGREPRLVVNKAVLATGAWKKRMAEFRTRFGE